MSPVGAAIGEEVDSNVSGVAALDAVRLRLVRSIVDEPGTVRARDALDRASTALAGLFEVDLSALDATTTRSWLEGVEELRRTVEAAAVAAAGVVDRSNPFRAQGFLSAKIVVKHMCKLSGPEAHRRVQTARLHEALPEWADAVADGRVGVAQSELMARVAANPRIPADVLGRDSPALLDDAISQSFDEFERRARMWEALADPDGDRDRNERLHANRDVRVRPRPEGGWTITGNLAELTGCEFNEIFSWFIEAEWHTDWPTPVSVWVRLPPLPISPAQKRNAARMPSWPWPEPPRLPHPDPRRRGRR
jgi:hypothetical protein